MTIKEAIKSLSNPDSHLKGSITPELRNAIKLGIEALRHISDFRPTVDGKPTYLLPGETKD